MTYPKAEWFTLACKDAAFFHAALSHYSGNMDLIQKTEDSQEAILHRMEAVRIVSERLSALHLATSDGTIGAISCIINYEVRNPHQISFL